MKLRSAAYLLCALLAAGTAAAQERSAGIEGLV